jgi:hypothetical protein
LRVRHDPAVSTYTQTPDSIKKKEQTGKAIIISRIIFEQGADRNTYTEAKYVTVLLSEENKTAQQLGIKNMFYLQHIYNTKFCYK